MLKKSGSIACCCVKCMCSLVLLPPPASVRGTDAQIAASHLSSSCQRLLRLKNRIKITNNHACPWWYKIKLRNWFPKVFSCVCSQIFLADWTHQGNQQTLPFRHLCCQICGRSYRYRGMKRAGTENVFHHWSHFTCLKIYLENKAALRSNPRTVGPLPPAAIYLLTFIKSTFLTLCATV